MMDSGQQSILKGLEFCKRKAIILKNPYSSKKGVKVWCLAGKENTPGDFTRA